MIDCRCKEEDKDAYLYYILSVHGQGRTIVFCTSIAALRHISSILRILGITVWTLHAQMQQRARLKVCFECGKLAIFCLYLGMLLCRDVAFFLAVGCGFCELSLTWKLITESVSLELGLCCQKNYLTFASHNTLNCQSRIPETESQTIFWKS